MMVALQVHVRNWCKLLHAVSYWYSMSSQHSKNARWDIVRNRRPYSNPQPDTKCRLSNLGRHYIVQLRKLNNLRWTKRRGGESIYLLNSFESWTLC